MQVETMEEEESSMKKIGIVGTRSRNTEKDFNKVYNAFDKIYEDGDWIVSGGCPKGGDYFAELIAKKKGVPILIFYPNWIKYKKAAGFIRNTYIAEESDILIACVANDRIGGTEDTIKKFLKKLFVDTDNGRGIRKCIDETDAITKKCLILV